MIQFEEQLSPAAARALLKVRFSKRDVEQMNALAAKARAGTLTPPEQVDIDNYERLGCLLEMLHSIARIALKLTYGFDHETHRSRNERFPPPA